MADKNSYWSGYNYGYEKPDGSQAYWGNLQRQRDEEKRRKEEQQANERSYKSYLEDSNNYDSTKFSSFEDRAASDSGEWMPSPLLLVIALIVLYWLIFA